MTDITASASGGDIASFKWTASKSLGSQGEMSGRDPMRGIPGQQGNVLEPEPSKLILNEKSPSKPSGENAPPRTYAELLRDFEKIQSEKADLQTQLERKNFMIDAQRLKLQRLTYAMKEALQFLSRSMKKSKLQMDEASQGAPGNPAGGNGSVGASVNGSAGSGSSPSTSVTRGNGKTSKETVKSNKFFGSSAPKISIVANTAKSYTTAAQFQIENMESIRFSVRCLSVALEAVEKITPETVEAQSKLPTVEISGDFVPLSGVADADVSSMGLGTGSLSRSLSTRHGGDSPKVPFTYRSIARDHKATSAAVERALEYDSGDLTETQMQAVKDDISELAEKEHRRTKSASLTCANCRSLMLQADQLKMEREDMKKDIDQLALALEAERKEKQRIEVSKQIFETELEELTASLFDQANRMVMDETRMREELAIKLNETAVQLTVTNASLQARELQLRDLKGKLQVVWDSLGSLE